MIMLHGVRSKLRVCDWLRLGGIGLARGLLTRMRLRGTNRTLEEWSGALAPIANGYGQSIRIVKIRPHKAVTNLGKRHTGLRNFRHVADNPLLCLWASQP